MLTARRLRELLDYNQRTGRFIWRVNRQGRWGRVGAKAGTIKSNGYRQICIDQDIYLCGRLAWLWMTGRWPKVTVDHINCIKADDRWCNLREATHSQNGANQHDRKSRVPFKGVTWVSRDKNYQAAIRINYRTITLGRFDTPEAAHAAYRKAARKHFGEFARFS